MSVLVQVGLDSAYLRTQYTKQASCGLQARVGPARLGLGIQQDVLGGRISSRRCMCAQGGALEGIRSRRSAGGRAYGGVQRQATSTPAASCTRTKGGVYAARLCPTCPDKPGSTVAAGIYQLGSSCPPLHQGPVSGLYADHQSPPRRHGATWRLLRNQNFPGSEGRARMPALVHIGAYHRIQYTKQPQLAPRGRVSPLRHLAGVHQERTALPFHSHFRWPVALRIQMPDDTRMIRSSRPAKLQPAGLRPGHGAPGLCPGHKPGPRALGPCPGLAPWTHATAPCHSQQNPGSVNITWSHHSASRGSSLAAPVEMS